MEFGRSYLNTGGRYNPSTDSWTTTSTTNAPAGREFHTRSMDRQPNDYLGRLTIGRQFLTPAGDTARNRPRWHKAHSRERLMAQLALSISRCHLLATWESNAAAAGHIRYQMIINFATSVTVGSASVTSGTGMVSSFSGSGTSQITVNLSGVTDVQRITMTLHNVNDGTHTGDVPISMGVLIGDVNGNAVVNASDVALTKSKVGQPVDGTNFREDVNANGTISSTDVAIVKSDVGTSLPP